MNNELKLRVVFDMVDRLTRPLKTALAGSKGLSRELGDLKKRLSELQRQQKTVDAVKALRAEMGQTATSLKQAQARLTELRTQIQATNEPTKRMQNAMRRASAATVALTQQQERQRTRLAELNARMREAGRGTQTLTDYEKSLRASIDRTNGAISEQARRLQAVHARQAALAPARARMQAAQGVASSMAVGGYAARATGTHLLGGLGETLGEAKKAQNESGRIEGLGLGERATKDAVQFARAMKVYGTSATDNLTMVRDSMTIFADEHHAQFAAPVLSQMKFANEAMFGAEQGHENEAQFMNMLKAIELRGGTKDEATFRDEANRIQKVITATGGRVGGDQWMEFIKRGGVAAKSLSKDAFYYQMEPIIQEMGGDTTGNALMSGYQNLIEGRTTIRAKRKLVDFGLLDPKKVEHDKNGHIKAFSDGALLNSEQFKTSPFEWMQKTLIPALAKKGITGDKAIVSTIGSMFTNRAASNLFSTMYLQRAQIEKSEKLNRGAYGIDDLTGLAKNQSSGKELEALAQLKNLKLEIGEKITPLYNQGLELTANLLSRVTNFMKEHGTTAKVLIVALGGLAALLVAGGTLTIGLAAIIGPLAVVRFGLAALGVQGGGTMAALRMLAGFLSGGFVGAIKAVFNVFGILARFAMANPIIAIVSLLAMAALYIWQNWGTLGPKFAALWESLKQIVRTVGGWISDFLMNWTPIGFVVDHWNDLKAIALAIWALIKSGVLAVAQAITDFFMNWTIFGVIVRHWDDIKAASGAAWEWVKEKALTAGGAVLDYFMNWTLLGLVIRHWDSIVAYMSGLADQFIGFGARLIDGLINGIMGGMNSLRTALHNVGESAIGWFKEKLGIHSPSRIFELLGGFIGQGAAQGIDGERARVAASATSLAGIASLAFGALSMAFSPSVASAPRFDTRPVIDTRPPLATARAASSPGAAAAGDSHYTINITVASGDPVALEAAAIRAIERVEREKRRRATSSLSDRG